MMPQRTSTVTALAKTQRGAAILVAMVTVALVASVAATAITQQWKNTQVEAAERHRVQAQWLLQGALDWSRLLLRQDAQSSSTSNVDHLAEPWAVPLQETRLSAFLSAQAGVSNVQDASTDTTDAYLAGSIQDLQSKINLLNMVYATDQGYMLHVRRLFERLGLPLAEFEQLRQGLRDAHVQAQGPSSPLMPQTLRDIAWLGISPATIAALDPYAVLLPEVTQINIHTAPAQVIWASAPGMDWGQAQAIVTARNNQHWINLEQAKSQVPGGAALSGSFHTVSSSYFSATGQVRLQDLMLTMQAQVRRAGREVTAQKVQTTATAQPATQGRNF